MVMEITALVTSARRVDDEYVLSAVTKKEKIVVISKEHIRPGAYVAAKGARLHKEIPELHASSIAEIPESKRKKAAKEIDAFIESNCGIEKGNLFSFPLLSKLSPLFDDAAREIKRAMFLYRPIIIRHDSDTDGLSAALALYKAVKGALNLKVTPEPWPIYKTVDAQDDIRFASSLDSEYLSPLLICCDFGSNPESFKGYQLARKSGFGIVVVDHHPITDPKVKELVDILVNPHLFAPESSYATGLLAVEIANRIADVDGMRLARVAMTGDRSRLIKPTDEDNKIAGALDFLISTSKIGQRIEVFARFLDDKEAIDVAYAESQEKMSQLFEKVRPKLKEKRIGGVVILLLNTDKLTVQGEYPKKGTVASMVADEFGKHRKEPVITATYGKRGVNLRLNYPAVQAGVNCTNLVLAVKRELPNALEGGGGHTGAAAMRVHPGFTKVVLDQLLKEIERNEYKTK
jgi:RecJ-like exonuclease